MSRADHSREQRMRRFDKRHAHTLCFGHSPRQPTEYLGARDRTVASQLDHHTVITRCLSSPFLARSVWRDRRTCVEEISAVHRQSTRFSPPPNLLRLSCLLLLLQTRAESDRNDSLCTSVPLIARHIFRNNRSQ